MWLQTVKLVSEQRRFEMCNSVEFKLKGDTNKSTSFSCAPSQSLSLSPNLQIADTLASLPACPRLLTCLQHPAVVSKRFPKTSSFCSRTKYSAFVGGYWFKMHSLTVAEVTVIHTVIRGQTWRMVVIDVTSAVSFSKPRVVWCPAGAALSRMLRHPDSCVLWALLPGPLRLGGSIWCQLMVEGGVHDGTLLFLHSVWPSLIDPFDPAVNNVGLSRWLGGGLLLPHQLSRCRDRRGSSRWRWQAGSLVGLLRHGDCHVLIFFFFLSLRFTFTTPHWYDG